MVKVHEQPNCIDSDPRCGDWAKAGECAANPSYMLTSCAKACRSCHLLDTEVRCRPMPGRTAAMGAGDLNATFARAVAGFPELGPRVLSTDPWVVVFDNFLRPDEVEALKRLGAAEGFTESVDAGERLPDGRFRAIKSAARTSETAWCVTEKCAQDDLVQSVTDRIANVSRVPYVNSEYLQVLHYQVGQYYVAHHGA